MSHVTHVSQINFESHHTYDESCHTRKQVMSPSKYDAITADNWGLRVRVYVCVQDQVLGELERIRACTKHLVSFCS